MTVSDDIRRHCIDRYVRPARQRGDYVVAVRAGDVHEELNLEHRLPQVCAALGAKAFTTLARVDRVAILGPLNSSTTLFVFAIRENL